jgi:3-hydroxyacyl-CoA dehydrogenase
MNTIGGDVLQAINKAIDLSERISRSCYWKPSSKFFCANIGMIFMMAVEQEYDEHGNQNISGYDDACALFNSQ